MTTAKTMRRLLCPICGAEVVVPADIPATLELPDHECGPRGNMCAGYVVTVSIMFAKCSKCGRDTHKHPSGLCYRCFKKSTEGGAA